MPGLFRKRPHTAAPNTDKTPRASGGSPQEGKITIPLPAEKTPEPDAAAGVKEPYKGTGFKEPDAGAGIAEPAKREGVPKPGKMLLAEYTDIGSRKVDEDSVRARERDGAVCLVVADGLGGHGGGEQASGAAAECVIEGWDGSADEEAMKELILQANRRVIALQTTLCRMKTTIVVLAIDGAQMLRAHVGDSRLYHFEDGRIVFQSRDHSVAQMSVMLGDITPDQIRFHEDRSRVLRALGQEDALNIEAGTRTLDSGSHAFLLCTDGFWEYVLEDEMEEDLAAADSPEDWLLRMRRRLARRVKEMYGDAPENDNNTAAALWLQIP